MTYLKNAFTSFRLSGGVLVLEECDVYTERRGREGGGVAEMIMTEMEGPPPSSPSVVMLTSNYPQVRKKEETKAGSRQEKCESKYFAKVEGLASSDACVRRFAPIARD